MNTSAGILSIAYGDLINPALSELFELMRMDKVFHRASGSSLYYLNENGNEKRVIDFVSGYGAVLLGHNPKELTSAAVEYFQDEKPGFVQLSVKEAAIETAGWLQNEVRALTGRTYITTFANSGSEAVEAAIKHALMEFQEKLRRFSEKFEMDAAYLIHLFSRKDKILASVMEEEIGRYRTRNQETIKNNAPLILAVQYAYHGKTLRAAMTCWNEEYHLSFNPENNVTVFIRPDPSEVPGIFRQSVFRLFLPVTDHEGRLEFRESGFNRVAGAILEPVQGEGGIRPLHPEFVTTLHHSCQEYDVPLIFDEIQTGCYRTGHLLASSEYGISADYYVLGKALGGGLAKIAALLVDKDRYLDRFGLIHSSTFAEDGWSSFIAHRALELSKKKSPEILEKGNQLKQRLERLKHLYPSVITDLRGRGLMLGLEFKDFTESNSYCFQILARAGYLHYLYAAYLLNVWNLRLAAPLSSKNVLRLQPSVTITEEDISRLMEGLSALCEIIYCEDFYKLVEFILPPSCQGIRETPQRFIHGLIPRERPVEGAQKIGFITHYIDADTIRAGDPSLAILTDEQLEMLAEKILPVSTPTILGSTNIHSENGKTVHITIAGLSLTSLQCRKAISEKSDQPLVRLCKKAVDVLKKEEQVSLVGLGQYTSILTHNGHLIPETGIGLTTGNSFTVYLAMEAVKASLRDKGIHPAHVKAGIIGAAGNIASITAELLSGIMGGIVLLGSSGSAGYRKALRTARNLYQVAANELLENENCVGAGLATWLSGTETFRKIREGELRADDPRLYEKLEEECGDCLFVRVVESPDALRECQVIVAATNAAQPFLFPEHFSPQTIICDLSVPHSCSQELVHNNKSIEVIFGGIARLPYGEPVPVKGFLLEPGNVYGCMGETLLLGLEGIRRSFSFGTISRKQVEWIGKIARQHGFDPVAAREYGYHPDRKV